MTAGFSRQAAEVEEPDVIELTPAEWQAAVAAGLQRVGLTRAELQEQAREKNFSSTEARKLWMIIGDEV